MRRGGVGLQSLEEFLYFDEAGLDSLSNQLTPDRLERFSIARSKGKENSVTGKSKFGFGTLLQRVGLPSVDVHAEGSAKRIGGEKRTEEFVVTRESRYRELITQLGGISALKRSLGASWHRATAAGSGDFFIAEGEFAPMPTANPDEWRDVANCSGMLQVQDVPDRKFTLGMSISKLIGTVDGEIRPTSHLALRFRGKARLRIFGKMDGSRYIKAYVVSW